MGRALAQLTEVAGGGDDAAPERDALVERVGQRRRRSDRASLGREGDARQDGRAGARPADQAAARWDVPDRVAERRADPGRVARLVAAGEEEGLGPADALGDPR